MKTIVMIVTLLLVASMVGCAIVPLFPVAPAPYYGHEHYYGPHAYEPYGQYGHGRSYGYGYRY
jgi:hypothetical protein